MVKLGTVVAQACDLSTWDAETRGVFEAIIKPQSKALTQNKATQNKKQ